MDKFYPVVLLGLKLGKNMFVNAEGAFLIDENKAQYIKQRVIFVVS
jgi:hypothetical protein